MTEKDLQTIARGFAPVVREVIQQALDMELAPLRQQIHELKTKVHELESQGLKYCGVWDQQKAYGRGDVVTHAGSAWVCREATTAKPGEADIASRAWQLVVKRGRDGRDGKDLPA